MKFTRFVVSDDAIYVSRYIMQKWNTLSKKIGQLSTYGSDNSITRKLGFLKYVCGYLVAAYFYHFFKEIQRAEL